MHYNDLVLITNTLTPGWHTIYDLPDGAVRIRNLGVRQPALSPLPEFRLYLKVDGRELTPRHSDFFVDFLLKVESRPELRLPLTESCEHVCNGASPQGLLSSKRLPRLFSELNEKSWTMQKAQDQTGGLPTEVFLCGLQVLIRVYELNRVVDDPREAFRKAYLGLEKGQALNDVIKLLEPQVMPGKRYFNALDRKLPHA
jgi:hypothetical protein